MKDSLRPMKWDRKEMNVKLGMMDELTRENFLANFLIGIMFMGWIDATSITKMGGCLNY